jgi:bifunctional polynucleotide phosphatase/kinase
LKISNPEQDGTIISTASGLRFGRDATDWKWWHNSVPSKLRSLHDEGFLLVILSNQAGIALKFGTGNMKRLTDLKRKATAVFTQLDLPMAIYAATTHDQYRKPRTGMWARMHQDFELKPDDIDYENSIFVGDAGGRVENGKLKKDFSCSDRNFSHNVGIAFKTPEEFFLREEPRAFLRDFDPAQHLSTLEEHNAANDSAPMFTKTNDLDIVLLCGSPGAGKSTFYWNVLKPLGYERVNQDILKTVRFLSLCEPSLRCKMQCRAWHVSAPAVRPAKLQEPELTQTSSESDV